MATAVARPGRLFRFHGLGAFFLTELRVQLHESTAILTSIIVQAVILVFVTILDASLLPEALFGSLVFSMFQMGQRLQNEAAYIRIDHKLNQLYLASPLTAEAYFLGMAGGVLVAYLPPVLVLGVLTQILVHPSPVTWLVLVASAAAVWVVACSIGYIVSTMFRDTRAIWSWSSLLYNLFGVLPPVFYPLAYFPAVLRPLALVLAPSAAAALINQARVGGVVTSSEAVFATTALAVESVGLLILAVAWARRTVRQE
jgi:ABC-2 type transport system permease protein